MSADQQPINELLRALQERAKELNCLYHVDEILNHEGVGLAEALGQLVEEVPSGWQFPESCAATVQLDGRSFQTPGFEESPWVMSAPVVFEGREVGTISVYYTERKPNADEGPFLKEERRLIDTIAERIAYFLLQRKLRGALPDSQATSGSQRWNVIVDFLRSVDRSLLTRITRRMVNHLCYSGVREAELLLQHFVPVDAVTAARETDRNEPQKLAELSSPDELAFETFQLATSRLSEDEVVRCVQDWIKAENASFLHSALENLQAPFSEIADALERFRSLGIADLDLPETSRTALRVALLRRFFDDDLDFIDRAKSSVRVEDFCDLVRRTIHFPGSHGKLGGKSAGLFVACRLINEAQERETALEGIRTPRTWYITSDGLLQFIRYNSLEDVYDRKYRDVEQVRQEYPYLIQAFKASPFPPELSKGLAAALDEFEERPIIVRSSSLLEDRVGAAFSGKYKSLFLANQGSKRRRLAALEDAVAEIYASVFGPDPIDYRAQRGLLDVHEEMGLMIQEVVGTRIGPYFLPTYAGVAYSSNEFRWSSRIRREDGLVRLVPGLGTRAVDRLSDDYPILLAPGQPELRVNVTADEVVRYSPKKIDLIDLESNRFETVAVDALLREHGKEIPGVHQLVSTIEEGHVRKPIGFGLDFENQRHAVTFEGLVADTPFVARLHTLLRTLQQRLAVPVDIEFASDGTDLYLLQCRAQGYSSQSAPAPIPRDLPRDRVLFTANRHISNGRVGDITHIVYVDDDGYQSLGSAAAMRQVGEVVGKLNKLLPKRQFILVGPGRWGSRGDIKLGVSVTYSQINNTAVLVEMARRRGNYVPDLSFGTHFFQDLVEAEIRYLPLYPDDETTQFNEDFFRRSHNILPELLPDDAALAETVRVIDVPALTGGNILRVLLNADLEEAVGLLATPGSDPGGIAEPPTVAPPVDDHWRWRLAMAERIASELDPARFGVAAAYVVGSAKNATAGPASDIDLLLHVRGDPRQREALGLWLDGWSRCLAEINFLRTGYRTRGLLDVHFLTDDDIERRTSFAVKIDAITDAARPLALGAAGEAEASS
ncbi:MAG: pyruvate, phosphate dikinase [Acidobacteriota bacterium]|nr:pyruvate, phosphate dikinase [Acidobacteriota bacterium]MDH3523935.1 pyruvate, phosphate dikinase [Acidobacteriota bacterium]